MLIQKERSDEGLCKKKKNGPVWSKKKISTWFRIDAAIMYMNLAEGTVRTLKYKQTSSTIQTLVIDCPAGDGFHLKKVLGKPMFRWEYSHNHAQTRGTVALAVRLTTRLRATSLTYLVVGAISLTLAGGDTRQIPHQSACRPAMISFTSFLVAIVL